MTTTTHESVTPVLTLTVGAGLIALLLALLALAIG